MPFQPHDELKDIHINQLLGRHDFHPYDPSLDASHPCAEYNATFYQCMAQEKLAETPLHLKHVQCYYPHKVELMKCLTKHKRGEKTPKKSDE